MPSSPFRDEGEPFKVMRVHSHESAIDPTGQPYIKAMLVITSDLSSDQGREFRITDGDMVRLSHMTDTPTPPDFDAAVDAVEDAARAECGPWIPCAESRENVLAARQRVRELHDNVVRERDAVKADNEDGGVGALSVVWVNEDWQDEFASWYQPEQWLGEHRAVSAFLSRKVREMQTELAELRAAQQQGEVFEVELIGDNEILGIHLWANEYVPGSKVRVTKIEEGA